MVKIVKTCCKAACMGFAAVSLACSSAHAGGNIRLANAPQQFPDPTGVVASKCKGVVNKAMYPLAVIAKRVLVPGPLDESLFGKCLLVPLPPALDLVASWAHEIAPQVYSVEPTDNMAPALAEQQSPYLIENTGAPLTQDEQWAVVVLSPNSRIPPAFQVIWKLPEDPEWVQ